MFLLGKEFSIGEGLRTRKTYQNRNHKADEKHSNHPGALSPSLTFVQHSQLVYFR